MTTPGVVPPVVRLGDYARLPHDVWLAGFFMPVKKIVKKITQRY